MKYNAEYHDFLGLATLDIGGYGAVVFTGISGSGKTCAMKYLAEQHAEFKGQSVCWICGDRLPWQPRYSQHWLVVDEIVHLSDLVRVRRHLARGHQVMLANHLPEFLLRMILIGHKTKFMRTDRSSNKLALFLDRKRVSYSAESLREFVSCYGQSYNSLSVVLEYSKTSDLSQALKRFQQHCRLALSRH